MNLDELFHLSRKEERVIKYLRRMDVIKRHALCPECDEEMYIDKDRKLFRCQKTRVALEKRGRRHKIKCDNSASIYSDSWFTGCKLNITKIFKIIFLYLHTDTHTQEDIAYEASVSLSSVNKIIRNINSVLDQWMSDCNREKVGGRRVKVDIDEMMFGGKKLRRGRAVTEQWVLGIRERVTGRLIVATVPNRSADTLISIIKRYVKRGTVITTDSWSSYSALRNHGYEHELVNHTLGHVNPRNGAHTQLIERTWRELRRLIPRYGIRAGEVGSKLSKFVFTYSTPKPDRITNFFRYLSNLYDPY